MQAREKRLDEMNRLGDLLHFPPLVQAGAAVNVMLTVAATRWFSVRHTQAFAPLVWIALVLALNLLPVALLRTRLTARTPYPTLAGMNFISDQHKFSDWVYLAASAHMAFWILLAWAYFHRHRTAADLVIAVAVAGAETLSPLLLRRLAR